MEEDKLKIYLNSINKMIRTGNPKYMSYISKQYMTYMKTNPVICEAIGDMLFKEVTKNEKSPYAIFLHDNGTVCLDAISDVSKISNISDFVGQIQELSQYDVDFSTVTPDDLIMEGDEMIAELERELQKDDLTKQDIEGAEDKASTALAKVGIIAAIGGTIGAVARGIFAKISASLSSLKKQKEIVPESKEEIKSQTNNASKATSRLSFDEVCPRVDVDEEKVIASMSAKTKDEELNKKRNTDTYGDGDPDGDDMSL